MKAELAEQIPHASIGKMLGESAPPKRIAAQT